MVSLLSNRIRLPRVARIPALFALANPTFCGCTMSCTAGQRRRVTSTLSSVEALSTTVTSWGVAGGVTASDERQFSRSFPRVVADDHDRDAHLAAILSRCDSVRAAVSSQE